MKGKATSKLHSAARSVGIDSRTGKTSRYRKPGHKSDDASVAPSAGRDACCPAGSRCSGFLINGTVGASIPKHAGDWACPKQRSFNDAGADACRDGRSLERDKGERRQARHQCRPWNGRAIRTGRSEHDQADPTGSLSGPASLG